MVKPTKWLCAQQRLRSAWASAQSDQASLLCTWRNLGSLATHLAPWEDSDQTGQLPRLKWVFAGRTCHFVGFVVRWLKCSILPYLPIWIIWPAPPTMILPLCLSFNCSRKLTKLYPAILTMKLRLAWNGRIKRVTAMILSFRTGNLGQTL